MIDTARFSNIIGDAAKIQLEHRIFTAICMISFLTAFFIASINFLFIPVSLITYIALAAFFINLAFYLLARFKQIYLYWLFIICVLITFSFAWIETQGPFGAVNYLYVMILLLLISFSPQRRHLLLFVLVVSNLVILNCIYNMELIDIVNDLHLSKRYYANISFTLVYVLIFTSFVFSKIKKSYEIERLNAEKQRHELNLQTIGIKENVKYASIIQQAIFNQERALKKVFYNYFILWKPRDDVSGDFYWIKQLNNKVIIAVGDCTGHGVSAAFLSVMGMSFLNEIVKAYLSPAEILLRLRRKMKKSLQQSSDNDIFETKDGLDMSLCIIDTESFEMEFAGAFHSTYVIRKYDNDTKVEVIELKGDRQPVGVFVAETEFSDQVIALKINDCIYMFSDGFYDQFGGEKNTKLLSKNFRKLLEEMQLITMKFTDQKEYLSDYFNQWKGTNEQIDDVLVLGFKISK